jgi:hypothetical protein
VRSGQQRGQADQNSKGGQQLAGDFQVVQDFHVAPRGAEGEFFMLRKPQPCPLSRIKAATNQQNTRKIAYSWFRGIALWK